MIQEHEVIWFPGTYHGRTDEEYSKLVSECSIEDIIKLVQTRAEEDANWAIETGHVGNNEEKMRRFQGFVSNETNIRQCIEHVYKEESETTRSIDWVCRDLANASKVMIR